MKKELKSVLIALGASFIWGVAFIAQADSTAPAFIFNAARSWVAFPFLICLILIVTKGDFRHVLSEKDPKATKDLWLGGFLCGTALWIATFLQQYGIDNGTLAGEAGFITALYMILVPIGGMFIGRKTGGNIWIAAVIAIAGLYMLCVGDSLEIRTSDLFVLGCAFCFTFQILFIDHFSVKCHCVKLSCVQFLTCAVLSSISALIFNFKDLANLGPMLSDNLWPILYLGILSSGVAYTLQMVAQKGSNPTAVSIAMSMESVFAVLAGLIIRHDEMPPLAYVGCALMLVAVLITQIDFGRVFRKKE